VNPAHTIAAALDRHLAAPTKIVVFGSAALLLDRRFAERLQGRVTNDIDIIIPASREMSVDADANFWGAIDAVNKELAPDGLYISHIFPERDVVLSANWHEYLQAVDAPFEKLTITRPRMLDLILSKMGRGDAQDVDDVRKMLRLEHVVTGLPITPTDIATAAANANVPEIYREIFPVARDAIIAAAQDEFPG
jgi:hypothetical protein